MKHSYSNERKSAVLKKLLPPQSLSVAKLSKEEGIPVGTLYTWRQQAKNSGVPVPNSGKQSKDWSAETKFAVVVETVSLSEAELGEYCRKKGLYSEEVKAWKAACIRGTLIDDAHQKQDKLNTQKYRQRIKELEKDLRHKEKALAETAALLVLRKKLNALWENDEGN